MKMISEKAMISQKYDDPIIEVDPLKEIRCQNIITYYRYGRKITKKCNRKLAVGNLGEGGKIEFHCERCGKMYRMMKIP